MGVGLFVTTLAYSVLAMIIVVPLYALGSALTNPTMNSLISKSVSENRQGMTLGVAQGLGALGRVLGPLAGTGLFQAFSPAAPYHVGAALLGVTWIISWIRLPGLVKPIATPAE
jgi:MFS family permease